jgi:hypothetical protein
MGGFGQNNRSERPFASRSHRYGDTIEIDVKKNMLRGWGYIHLAQY